MKLETFFEKFDLFADVPEAMERMRELLLDLAVRGRLVAQDTTDEPAAELLERLIEFKLANPLTGRSGRGKEGSGQTEAINNALPANWVNTTVGEVLYVIRGASPRPKGDPQYFSEKRTSYHWVKISDIRKHGQNGLLMDTDEFLTEAGMHRSVLLPKGTLVLTNSATIGVPIVLGIEGCCIHDGYLAFPNFPHELLNQKFLLYLFHTLKKHAERNARGLAQLNLNTDLVRSFPFGLPPLAEQKRIVAKVDELMALCDRLEAQQQERETRHAALARASLARFAEAPTPANLQFLFHESSAILPDDLRRSILTLAVQGKLVLQDPDDEQPEGALLKLHQERTHRAKAGKLRAAKLPANAFLEEPLPFLPNSWRSVSFEHVAVTHNNALKAGPFGSALKKEFYVENGYKIYGQEQVIAGDPFIGDYYIDEKKFAELDSCAVAPSDILISLVGTIGKILVLPEGIKPGIINPRLIKLSLDASVVYPPYIKVLIGSPYAVNFFEENAHGGTMNILNLSILRALPIPLPPLAEQRRIVARVDELMSLVDRLEADLAAARAQGAALLDALVVELTSQS